MALISCPECNHQVSDQAASCPSCGHPIVAKKKAEPQDSVQTIEKTGKKYKALQATGCFCAIIAIFTIVVGNNIQSDVGLIMAIFAAILLVWGSIGAWWRHG